jgi:hypothetical protein
MIKRSTWILLAILALVLAAYFFIKNNPSKSSQTTPTAQSDTYLFTPANGTLQSLQISDAQGNMVRMQRDLTKVWVITAPTNATADQGLAGAAETQVGALRIITSLDTSPDLSAINLATPGYTIEVTFDNGTQHKLEVGSLTPTSSGYYVRYDGSKIMVISQSGIDSLLNLLKSPPYPPTPTPVTTETPTAEINESVTEPVSPTP